MFAREIGRLIEIEIYSARAKWPDITGAHEGASLIQEELEEFRREVHRDQRGTNVDAASECIQIAAMVIRTLEDVYT